MITSLANQGGRKYQQFANTASGMVNRLSGFGTSATIPPVVPPAASGGGGGGGSTQNQRNSHVDFDIFGKSRRPPEKESVEKVSRETADKIIEESQKLAREKAALNALNKQKASLKRAEAKAAKIAAAEAKMAQIEANLAILRDDEEVLQILMKMLSA